MTSENINTDLDLLFSKSDILSDPDLFYDYCEICNVSCDQDIPHSCADHGNTSRSQAMYEILDKYVAATQLKKGCELK